MIYVRFLLSPRDDNLVVSLIDIFVHTTVQCQLVPRLSRKVRKRNSAVLPYAKFSKVANSSFTLALFVSAVLEHNMAQSTMAHSQLGVHFFWDKGHQTELDWDKWLSTVKLATMVKDNIQVEKLLRPKPESEDLGYPTQPNYGPALSDEATAERRQHEQRNQKRRTDWQN